MKRPGFWLQLFFSFGGALLASEPSLRAQAQPQASLSIAFDSNAIARLVLSGASGKTYRLAATKDFQSWTNWPPQKTDGTGRIQFAIPSLTERLFFQAVSASSSPEVALGKRLFLETRFAQFFFAHGGTDLNTPLTVGDPVLDQTLTLTVPAPGPFAGQSMNCRACHLQDEQTVRGLGHRSYADFGIRSPIP
jgi:hypothetical protein